MFKKIVQPTIEHLAFLSFRNNGSLAPCYQIMHIINANMQDQLQFQRKIN